MSSDHKIVIQHYLDLFTTEIATFFEGTPVPVLVAFCAAFALLLIVSVLLWLRVRSARRALIRLEARFSPVVDAQAEAARVRRDAQAEAAKIKRGATELLQMTEKLRANYKTKRETYDRLLQELAIFDERIAFAELGVYEPHFDFTDSEAYKHEIKKVRSRQKAMISAKTAVPANVDWTVDGSRSKGQTMINRQVRLTLRAFNNECEAAIANVRWNNVNAMERRIERAREQINKFNASHQIEISRSYVSLKREELQLTHEMREKIKVEKDERREAARLAREEERLTRDAENAEREETRYEKLLAKARAEAEAASGEKLEAFREKIETLERDLAEAHERVEKARSMAEQTRAGHVYVISNMGSFGEDIIKIGLTRRLDPDDRIRELGDASVPFLFDTHALIYSEDAPALESALHSEFDSRRVNAANPRKEFFRVGLDEIEQAVGRLAPDANFFRDREAQEYRETLALRNQQDIEKAKAAETAFPDEL